MIEEKDNDKEEWKELPSGVLERLEKYAERMKRDMNTVYAEFLKYIEHHGCYNWKDEEEDLLEDWTEQMVVEFRTSSGSSMSGMIPYVGCFVGVAERTQDRRVNLVRRAKRDFTLDASNAVDSGFVGHYEKSGGKWILVTKNGKEDVGLSTDEVPEHTFIADGERICLLAQNGKPKAMSMLGRYYYFLGAPEEQFTNDNAIQMWRLDMQGEDRDAEVIIGEPCTIMARPPNENAAEGWKDVLNVPMGTRDNIVYNDGFVKAEMTHLLNPYKLWLDKELHGIYTPLEDLVEAYETGSRSFTINGEQGKSGPIVFTKGTVNRMSTEGRDSEYDERGKSYSLSLTSTGLHSSYGQGNSSEVMCWISGACNDLTSPFVARQGEEIIPYAERSTVLVCGRVAVKRQDGRDIPSLKVLGVYAHPRRIRKREDGGDTSKSQFE